MHRPLAPRLCALALATSQLAACGKAKPSDAASSASAPPASAAAAPTSSTPPAEPAPTSAAAPPSTFVEETDPNTTPAEPQRRTLRAVADEPALYTNRDFVADQYGVARLPLPLELQTVPLPHARRALLFTGQGAALEKPLILVVDANQTILWNKERPLVGTHERARELTLSRGPHGEVLLFWYDEPTRVFAGREWNSEGGIFADYNVLSAETCDAAAVLYWPAHGWIAAVADGTTLRVQLIAENGTRAWPANGVDSPGPRVTGRLKIAIQSGKIIEISAGPRKLKLSPEGAILK